MVQCQRTEIWPLLEDSNQDASIIMENCVEITVKTATKEAMQNCLDLYFSLRKRGKYIQLCIETEVHAEAEKLKV